MIRLRSPIRCFGGKGNMVAKILPLLPDHDTYVEPFGGGASILMAKPPAKIEVYNDLDPLLISFWRVMADPDMFHNFWLRAAMTPCARSEFYQARDSAPQSMEDQAYALWIMQRLGFSGTARSWSFAMANENRGMSGRVSQTLSAVDLLPAVHERVRHVTITQDDGIDIIMRYDGPGALIYCDPPYVQDSRSGGGYRHEMNDEQHDRLVDTILRARGKIVVSGYDHPIYQRLDRAGWIRAEVPTACYATGRTRASGRRGAGNALKHSPRVEVVWRSPSCVAVDTGLFGTGWGGNKWHGM